MDAWRAWLLRGPEPERLAVVARAGLLPSPPMRIQILGMTVALVAVLGGCNKDKDEAKAGDKAKADHTSKHSSKSPEDFPAPAQLCKDAVAAIAAAEMPDGLGPDDMDKMKAMRDQCIAALTESEGQAFSDRAECIVAAKSYAGFEACQRS